MRQLPFGLLCVLATPLHPQVPAPAPDVFLVGIRAQSTGKGLELTGAVRNVTNHDGYDNQPSWSSNGRYLLFTAVRDGAQADIFRYEVETGTTERLTHSAPESEYSARTSLDGGSITVVRVEKDSTQRLWKIPMGPEAPTPILPSLKPAGYYAWASPSLVAVFVLGNPNALVLGDVTTGKIDTVARNVGRSLHRIPGTDHISYTERTADGATWVQDLDPALRSATRLARLPAGVEDYAWTPGGSIITSDGAGTLLAWSGDAWQRIGDLASEGLGSISRLSVSPNTDWIAVVAVPASRR